MLQTVITQRNNAAESGKRIIDQTVKAFGAVAEDMERSNRDVLTITDMVRQNVDIAVGAVNQIERISGVVEENAQISQNTKLASANMAEITCKLLELVEQ